MGMVLHVQFSSFSDVCRKTPELNPCHSFPQQFATPRHAGEIHFCSAAGNQYIKLCVFTVLQYIYIYMLPYNTMGARDRQFTLKPSIITLESVSSLQHPTLNTSLSQTHPGISATYTFITAPWRTFLSEVPPLQRKRCSVLLSLLFNNASGFHVVTSTDRSAAVCVFAQAWYRTAIRWKVKTCPNYLAFCEKLNHRTGMNGSFKQQTAFANQAT